MSLSDGPLQGELDTLRRLRRHRADRAERALHEARRTQQALLIHIDQAQAALEQTRLEETRASAQLLAQHQGQVLTFQALKVWSAQEHSLSAGTRHEAEQLQQLHTKSQEQELRVGSAQRRVSECLRQVEKLQELSILLAQEQA